jgi:hypothetical protein
VEKLSRNDLLPPLPLWKMVERFATGMFKGIGPLYLLAVAAGLLTWRSRDGVPALAGFQGEGPAGHPVLRVTGLQRASISAEDRLKPGLQPGDFGLAFAAALILAAIWVHLYWSHEAGPRYFFPIVLMAAPWAGWGLLQISAAVANRVRRQHSSRAALLAGAAPLAAMLVVNLSVAWGGDVRSRAGAVDLGRWVRAHCGSAAKMFGPDGITQVVNHYAQIDCESFPETAPAAAVVRQIQQLHPNVVLLSTDRRDPEYRVPRPGSELADGAAALGFEAVDRSSLPGGCEKLQVLVRWGTPGHVRSGSADRGGNGSGDKP